MIWLLSFSLIYSDSVQDLKHYISENLESFPGWCSQEKAFKLADWVIKTKPDIYVEIGVYAGKSIFPVAATMHYIKHGKIVGIDAWDVDVCLDNFDPIKDEESIECWANINFDHFRSVFEENIHSFGLSYLISVASVSSKRAVQILPEIDFLHIDGNRKKNGTLEDLNLYLPKVKYLGIICLNDADLPEMIHSKMRLERDCKLVDTVGNGKCLFYQKVSK